MTPQSSRAANVYVGTDPCTITLDADTHITATFGLVPAEMASGTVTLDGDGSVTSDPAASDMDQGTRVTVIATFPVGTVVTLTPRACS